MAQQIINVGSAPNDGDGDPLRTAFIKTNDNFTELYGGNIPAGNSIANGNSNVEINSSDGNVGISVDSNANVGLFTPDGLEVTGNVTGNYFIGNGSQLTGLTSLATTSIANGNSNVAIETSGGNVGITVRANANIALFTVAGMSVIGSIAANGSVGTAGIMSATGNIIGNYFIGNGSQLTGITVSANLSGNLVGNLEGNGFGANAFNFVSAISNVTAGNIVSSGITTATGNVIGGNVRTAGVVTATGNVIGGNLVTAGAVSATGNITGNFFIGNGSQLTGITTSATLSGNLVGNLEGNGFGANAFNFVSATGNVIGGNIISPGVVTATGNVIGGNVRTAGVVSATGNITGSFFIGNGSALTGITASANLSGNLVGNLQGNGFGANAFSFVSATGNITGNYFFGNGSQLTSLASTNVNYSGAGANAVVRTVSSKLQESISVKDFGAVGNGIANDAPAFNLCIAALVAAGGGTMVIPAGTYLLNSTVTIANLDRRSRQQSRRFMDCQWTNQCTSYPIHRSSKIVP
jgi:hypothetical protein